VGVERLHDALPAPRECDRADRRVALNAGGMTLHRFCGMMLGPQAGQSNEEYFVQLRRDPRRSILAGFNRVRRCEVLVVAEISMLPGRQLDFVEFLFRRLRGRDEPFGGCQVIVGGDFLQLPPVRTAETEPYDWAFQSPAWAAGEFKMLVLETVRRQDEPQFVKPKPIVPILKSKFRQLQETGSEAELFFMNNFKTLERFKDGKLKDARLFGDGYDFQITIAPAYVLAEVKGVRGASGEIRLTENEFIKTDEFKEDYCIAVVSQLETVPRISVFFDPLKVLPFTKQTIASEQVFYSAPSRRW
jgi:hypothetical protein